MFNIITLMTLVQATFYFQGESPTTYIHNEDTHTQSLIITRDRNIIHSLQTKTCFDENFDLTSGMYFYFFNKYLPIRVHLVFFSVFIITTHHPPAHTPHTPTSRNVEKKINDTTISSTDADYAAS